MQASRYNDVVKHAGYCVRLISDKILITNEKIKLKPEGSSIEVFFDVIGIGDVEYFKAFQAVEEQLVGLGLQDMVFHAPCEYSLKLETTL
jgi:hypothetical protein